MQSGNSNGGADRRYTSVPGVAQTPDARLRVKNGERELIFAEVQKQLPLGATEREAAILAKFIAIDEMVRVIAEREKMSAEDILALTTNQSGFTILHVAAQHGRSEMVDYLFREHLFVNRFSLRTTMLLARNVTLDRPIHIAARSDSVDFIRSLVARGVTVNSSGAAGFTPLHFAVQLQHRQLIIDLVDMGSDLNVQNRGGETPLHLAVHKGDLETVKYLLDKGADATVRNAGDSMPGVVARGVTNRDVHQLFVDRGLPY
ncbi:hypothetical protein PG996_008712 [Apiospora saccharicola]|uniref:Ankyrin repeat domain-containing protein n=1 Tax=Apiospora saccharicola TaxID=335842 RepID=A0ABR1UYR5_9PEZI